MTGPISEFLIGDHRRIAELLARARAGDSAAYDELRGALLRHIGIEEKILLRAIRARAGEARRSDPTNDAGGHGDEPSLAIRLRRDHSAIAAMLVPPPSPELLARLAELLALHDPLEEGESGLYAHADELLADDPDIVERMRQAPIPPLAPNFAGERAYLAIEELVARAAAARRKA
ncbi:Proteophosphoglycan 5 [Labilithrix luteola]|uniref:Proteophosphoglycan 5 n=1 Tax=Labilithrix luteola TaxID=1391654 RepID=A0A0K1Q6N0_9BACT|nr:hemerythrin domain-containing protein [Labilithrix luteola]AKV01393.1 Proteophosphoglycan 5 [Labilithrix luteola]